MTTPRVNSILPPPSVDDLLTLGSEARVGKVDFANPLVPLPAPEQGAPATIETGTASRASVLARQPVVEPKAEAVVEAPPEPASQATPAPTPATTPSTKPSTKPSTRVKPSSKAAAPTIEPVAPAILEDSAYLGGTVQEVADAAIERLRDAENATLQHLAALEAEASRRAELLTAQAELDAELIRINARREAHAIISAARDQAGLGAPSSRDARQLVDIGDAVSRFAESIESTLTPVHLYPSGDQA